MPSQIQTAFLDSSTILMFFLCLEYMSPCLSFFIQVLGSLTSLSKFAQITPGVSTLTLQHLTQATDTTLILQIYR